MRRHLLVTPAACWAVCLAICCVISFAAPAGAADLRQAAAHAPYSPDSPWNLEIGPNPAYDPDSGQYMAQMAVSGHFGSDPTQFTMPVYLVDADTPRARVDVTGWYSEVTDEDRYLDKRKAVRMDIPIPDEATQATGSDAQMILWDPATGDEWGFWQIYPRDDGSWKATNGYHYNTHWDAVPPTGFQSRGAGVPYLTGLIRAWEIEQGRIDHAIALATNIPAREFIYPATKSDGKGYAPDLPSGARVQLNPALTEADFDGWGLGREGKIIARALQRHGMIVIDGSGHPKIYAEYTRTAGWKGRITGKTVRSIPYEAFRVLDLAAPARPHAPGLLTAKAGTGVILSWQASAGANRYRVLRRDPGDEAFVELARGLTRTDYVDATAQPGTAYEYAVVAVNHNGVSAPSLATPE